MKDFFEKAKIIESMGGWISRESHAIFDFLLNFQKSNELHGNLMEIGVYHGKTSAVMSEFVEEGENLFMVDPWLEAYKSEILKNLESYSQIEQNKLKMLSISSQDLIRDIDKQLYGSFRFIHIDGNHTAQFLYNDLITADKLLNSVYGIVAIDDFMSYLYPQVTECVYKYLHLNPFSFRLILTAYNKAYLVRTTYYSKLYKFIYNFLIGKLNDKKIYSILVKSSSLGDSYTLSLHQGEADSNWYRGEDVCLVKDSTNREVIQFDCVNTIDLGKYKFNRKEND